MKLEPTILTIKMIKFGKILYQRNLVSDIFEKIKKESNFSQHDLILVDFTEVESVSSGFAFDLFQLFKKDLGIDFLKKIRVRFDPVLDTALVKSVVGQAIDRSK